jgi:cohesin complex subunit SA-1/2
LISKSKSTRSFRELLTSFFKALIVLMHETEAIYKDDAFMDNVHRWVASMSSSTLRPFRHTATTIALSIETGLVEVARTLDKRITSIELQISASKKAKSKQKLVEIQRTLDEANHNRELCSNHIKDIFETVFVHRYRDIDARIRTECIEALGFWIWHLPTDFMKPDYLRYLGWMLSDVVHTTRLEVLRQLTRLFKRDAHELGHFIDRFRPRLIEMATKDSEVAVRVAAISVIDTLRATGMLEPDEIDSIGKLIFDSELRIRKSVVGFFVACVQDLIDTKVEEMGGSDVVEEAFSGTEEDDTESPRREWLNIKCLAETLAAYDAQIEDREQDDAPRGVDITADVLQGPTTDTRISLASQVLYERVVEVKKWEILAGYLLYDHSTSSVSRSKSKSKSRANTTEAIAKNAVVPEGPEESILLEVLSSAVKLSMAQSPDVDKTRRKGARAEALEAQEETALQLATTIPRLLNKFGADAGTATVVLRLEHFLDLDVFLQLRQDSSTYEKLLDEISTQFNRHDDKGVLSEAASALLHARQYDELEELTDSKLSVLWENVINSLRNFDKTCELSVRGNLAQPHLMDLSTILVKIGKLASISDCVDFLEAEGRSADSASSVIEILCNTIQRGKYEQLDDDLDDLEDEVASYAIKCCQFYFMWKARTLVTAMESGTEIPGSELDNLAILRRKFYKSLVETLSSRGAIDDIRLFATGSLCDLHVLFASQFGPGPLSHGPQVGGKYARVSRLVEEIEPGLIPELIAIFDGTEKVFAKKTKKTLNEPAEDEDPIDDDSSDDEDEDEGLTKQEKHTAELKAEKALCELAAKYVLAITAKVLDQSGKSAGKLRRRLLRNQNKLGPNYREIVAYLDEQNLAAIARGGKKGNKPGAGPDKGHVRELPLSEEIVVADDDDPFADIEPEEGSREDLRRRELLEDDEDDED